MSEEFESPEGPENLENPPAFFPYDEMGRPGSEGPTQLIEVQVEGVFAAETAGKIDRLVLLSDGERKLPIMIGPIEAVAIQSVLERHRPDRPGTHDLVKSMLDRLESGIERVVIDDMWSTTYYAKIYIKKADQEIEIDSRPSDGIALALRYEAPIFVADSILESAASGQ